MQPKQVDTSAKCSVQESAAKGAMYLETKLKAKTVAQNTTS